MLIIKVDKVVTRLDYVNSKLRILCTLCILVCTPCKFNTPRESIRRLLMYYDTLCTFKIPLRFLGYSYYTWRCVPWVVYLGVYPFCKLVISNALYSCIGGRDVADQLLYSTFSIPVSRGRIPDTTTQKAHVCMPAERLSNG